MTQQQNPSPPSQFNQPPQQQMASGRRTEKILISVWEPLDLLGNALMGELWRTVYLSIQDAIALSVLLRIPGLVGQWIIGKDFSSFDVCLQENAFGASRYACSIIVASDFLLWIVLAGRIIGRFWADLSDLSKGKGGNGHGSGRP